MRIQMKTNETFKFLMLPSTVHSITDFDEKINKKLAAYYFFFFLLSQSDTPWTTTIYWIALFYQEPKKRPVITIMTHILRRTLYAWKENRKTILWLFVVFFYFIFWFFVVQIFLSFSLSLFLFRSSNITICILRDGCESKNWRIRKQ